MQKYNFFDIRGKDVPEDLNKPVHDMLINDLKCSEASEELRLMEKGKNCGGIQIFFKDKPKYIDIKTNYGMVEGYDQCRDFNTDRYMFTVKRHIKNHMLSMKKPKRKWYGEPKGQGQEKRTEDAATDGPETGVV